VAARQERRRTDERSGRQLLAELRAVSRIPTATS
jgi:hypothetical protein